MGGDTTHKKTDAKYIASEVERLKWEKISMSVINYEV